LVVFANFVAVRLLKTLLSFFISLLSITNKMQHYTIFFIAVNFLHVSGGFSALHQELKILHIASFIRRALLAATASVGEFQITYASGSSKQARHITDAVFTILSS
jgi:hypothetical protein